MADAMNIALKDRNCEVGSRPPTNRYPFYQESKTQQIAIAGTSSTFTFKAPRDLLLYYLAVDARLATDGTVVAGTTISQEYCDTKLIKGADAAQFSFCCDRKPLIVLGVKDTKEVTYTVTIPAQLAATDVTVTIAGVQGDGCCD